MVTMIRFFFAYAYVVSRMNKCNRLEVHDNKNSARDDVLSLYDNYTCISLCVFFIKV